MEGTVLLSVAVPAPLAEVSDTASLWALCWELRVVVGDKGAERFVVAAVAAAAAAGGGGELAGCATAAALVDSDER